MNQQTVAINGQTFKIGLHGKVFVHRLGEWVRSMEYKADDILRRMKSKDKGDDRKKSDWSKNS